MDSSHRTPSEERATEHPVWAALEFEVRVRLEFEVRVRLEFEGSWLD